MQESRTQELRETHSLESSSTSSQLEKTRNSLSGAESSLAAVTTERDALRVELDSLKIDVTKAKATAKEEEEKRTKAISLLKTVRQKLVKADQAKDEALADREAMRVSGLGKDEEARQELEKVRGELDRVKADRERDVRGLREKFEGEVKGLRAGFERENKTRREEAELKAVTTAVSPLSASHSRQR